MDSYEYYIVVASSDITVAYFEIKMFSILPQIYPRDFMDFSFVIISFSRWFISQMAGWF